MNSIWNEVRETVAHRIATVERAVVLLLQKKLNQELRQQAEQEIHKLVGSMGMFGADQGSRLAQEIEPLFQKGRSLNHQEMQQLSKLVAALRQELQHLDAEYLTNEQQAVTPVDIFKRVVG